MTDATSGAGQPAPKPHSLLAPDARTRKRNAAEARFRIYGMIAVGLAVIALVFLLTSIVRNGAGAFMQTFVTLEVTLDEAKLDKSGTRDPEEMAKVTTFGYAPLIKDAMAGKIAELGIEIEGLKKPEDLISKEAAAQMRDFVLANPDVVGTTRTFEFLAAGRCPERGGRAGDALQLELHHLARRLREPARGLWPGRRDPGLVLHDDYRAGAGAAYRRRRVDLS